jgi:hypothetical protein
MVGIRPRVISYMPPGVVKKSCALAHGAVFLADHERHRKRRADCAASVDFLAQASAELVRASSVVTAAETDDGARTTLAAFHECLKKLSDDIAGHAAELRRDIGYINAASAEIGEIYREMAETMRATTPVAASLQLADRPDLFSGPGSAAPAVPRKRRKQ